MSVPYRLIPLHLLILLIPLTQCADSELSFTGSPLIARHILPEAVRNVEKISKIEFGEMTESDDGGTLAALRQGERSLGGVVRPIPPPDGGGEIYTVVIGYDVLGITVHKQNRLRSISRKQLRDIYAGKIRNWGAIGGGRGAIHPLLPAAGDDGKSVLQFFNSEIMKGEGIGENVVYPGDTAEAARIITRDRGSICVSRMVWSEVRGDKTLALEGVFPGLVAIADGKYKAARSLNIITRGFPETAARIFLRYMLSPAGQRIVARRHLPAFYPNSESDDDDR